MRFPVELWASPREQAAVLARVGEASEGPLFVIDRLGNVVFANAAAEAWTGERGEALVNRAAVSVLGLDEDRAAADDFGRAIDEGRAWEGAVRPRREGAVSSSRQRKRLPARRARLNPVAADGAARSGCVASILVVSAKSPRSSPGIA